MTTPNLMWAYPWDLLDEGVGPALDRMADRARVTGVAVAALYHAGKFLHPNNPRRRVVFPRSGTLYFPPDPSWHGRLTITPPVWPEAATHDPWPLLRRECDARGLGLTAWTLCLHNSGIGRAHPNTTVQNAFGDRIATDLCATNPDVATYLAAVTRDIAGNLPVDRILLESLEFMPFAHDYHHEVIGVPVGPTIGLLMALCFCRHCLEAAAVTGLDTRRLRHWVVARLDEHFADPFAGPPEWSWEELRAGDDGQLGAYLDVRRDAVARLLRDVVAGIRDVSDCSVAALDFGPLYPNGPDGRRWESGADLDVLTDTVDELHPTFYFTDLDLHRDKVETYLDLIDGTSTAVHPAIRAILPQTADAERLEAQLAPLSGRVDGVSFYNYGFMARQTLDWIGDAVAGFSVRTTAPEVPA